METNYEKHLSNIILTIERNILREKKGMVKKYTVKNNYMFDQITKYINDKNLNVKFSKFISNTRFSKRLENIYEGYDSGCCTDCDKNMEFGTKYVPIIYIEIEY